MVAHSTLSSSFQPHRVNSRGSTHSKCLYQFDTRVIESQVESWLTVLETRPSNGFSLVSCCFEPSQLQRITSGLNTNFTLSPSYSFHMSSYKSFFFFSLFIFHGHSTREPASSRVTYFILQAYTGTGVKHSQHGKKSGEVLEKNAGEWTRRVEISKEEIPGSKRSMYGFRTEPSK